MGKRMRVRLMDVVICLALVGVWALLAVTGTALAAKPDKPGGGKGGGDDGNTNLRLVRIHCAEWSRIQWDGGPVCVDSTRPDDPEWHYWDQRDVAMADQWPLECGVQSGVSGGGRLFFFTATDAPYKVPKRSVRWLVLDFPTPPEGDDGNGPNIDADLYYEEGTGPLTAPRIDYNTYVDNVKTIIKLDGMFKKTVTRQPLEIAIRGVRPDGSWELSGWSLHSVEDLYVKDDDFDKDVRTLTTVNPDTDESDADWFSLRYDGIEIARYRLPLAWTMRIVSSP